jgi:formylglycine-generating enzyme required for sulfatase activity
VVSLALAGCIGHVDGQVEDAGLAGDAAAQVPDASPLVDAALAGPDAPPPGPCPQDMALVGAICMDLYEAPNERGALPLVMYTLPESEAWCQARGKRLCYDDEWTAACAGPAGRAYPYGNVRVPGQCNDHKLWKAYNQTLLNGWPRVSTPDVTSLAGLFQAARAVGGAAMAAADHVEQLYQGEGGGAYAGCVGPAGVYDLVGSVEEWTRRRDGGEPSFRGNLKGRYWAESRTCQGNVRTHADGFRFYEIGFRCCQDR